MRTPFGAFIISAIMLALDFYFYQALKTDLQNANPKLRNIVLFTHWTISFLVIISFLIFIFTAPDTFPKKFRSYLFATIVGIFFAKMIAAFFFLIDDIRRLFQWIASKTFFRNTEVGVMAEDTITRSTFLSWLGIAAGGGLFSSFIYGYGNKYNYQVKNVQLKYPNLPESFNGFKIVQISDIHCGSFTNKKAVEHGVDMILAQNADMILFTGDLVNNLAEELHDYKDVFAKLKAPSGVYSILGNHDYGDYVQWPMNGLSKAQNLENIKSIQQEMGWRLMMNEHIAIEKNGEQIGLLGVENWSAKARFPKHGKLDLAYAGAEKYPFKILMSHDPSHWHAQVVPNYQSIDLTLSGHTHGMQFGVEIPGFKWSPVQYVYKEWAGLYEDKSQKLYVNPGFGFIGYPGRVGVLPEITVIELSKT